MEKATISEKLAYLMAVGLQAVYKGPQRDTTEISHEQGLHPPTQFSNLCEEPARMRARNH